MNEAMRMRRRFTFSNAILAIEGAVACYVAFMAFLLSSWMVNDSTAFQMQPADWWITAGIRFLKWLAVAVAAAAAVYLVNKLLCKALDLDAPKLPKQGALLVGSIIGLAALIGSLEFAIEKPFM